MSSNTDGHLLQPPSQHQGNGVSEKRSTTRVSAAPRPAQPDGGWGWVVCMTSLACNGTVFGILNCFGIIYVAMRDQYAKDDPNISFKTSWVGSVATGMTFFMCMLSSIVSDRIGVRVTGVFGGIVAFIGILSSAFVEELMLLYLTYGVLMGVGFASCYAPSLVILGHYFKRHMGLVNGIVTFGSSVFTISLALGLPPLLDAIGLRYTLIVLAGLVLMLVPYAITWKPIFTRENLGLSQAAMSTLSIEMIHSQCAECCRFTKKYLNVSIWKNRGYVVWALSCGFSLFGYFVPFVHLIKHVNDVFPGSDGNILVMCIAITSGVARIVCGKVADFKFVNRIRMQQLAFAILGICTLCIPFSASFGGLIAITLIMGISDGTTICLFGPIAFDLVGERSASQALGFLFGIFSVPMTVGPPVAGLLYDYMKDYNIAFHVAGCPPIIGALLMFFIPKIKPNVPAVTSIQEFAAVSCHDIYHSRLEVETTVDPPNVNTNSNSSKPEIITIDDVSKLALLSNSYELNGKLRSTLEEEEEEEEEEVAEEVVVQEDGSLLPRVVVVDEGKVEETKQNGKEEKATTDTPDKGSGDDGGASEASPMIPKVQVTDLDEDMNV